MEIHRTRFFLRPERTYRDVILVKNKQEHWLQT